MENRALYLDKSHTLTLVEEPIPVPAADEVVVRIMANGICGSDVHFFRDGRLGNFVVEDPYVPGHECSGYIHAVGSAVAGWKEGDRVVIEPGIPCGHCAACLGGRYNLCGDVKFLSEPGVNGTFCDYIAVRADAVHPMPDGMSYEIGALAEPVAVAVHAVNRAGNVNGLTGVVLGAGPIGLLTMQAFLAAGGARVICVDINAARLAMARELGACRTILAGSGESIADLGDVVFETAGSPVTTAQLFTAAKKGGICVQVGWPSGNVVQMNIADMIDKELDYVTVNRYANAFPTAIAWLADGRIRGEKMITDRFPLSRADEAFRHTAENAASVIKTMVLND